MGVLPIDKSMAKRSREQFEKPETNGMSEPGSAAGAPLLTCAGHTEPRARWPQRLTGDNPLLEISERRGLVMRDAPRLMSSQDRQKVIRSGRSAHSFCGQAATTAGSQLLIDGRRACF